MSLYKSSNAVSASCFVLLFLAHKNVSILLFVSLYFGETHSSVSDWCKTFSKIFLSCDFCTQSCALYVLIWLFISRIIFSKLNCD